MFVHPQAHKLFKIPTVLSKYAVTEDRWDQQQLITAILKKYDTSNLKIGKRYSVNTISNKSGQQAVLKTTRFGTERIFAFQPRGKGEGFARDHNAYLKLV